MTISFYSQSFCQKSAEKKVAEEILFAYIVLMSIFIHKWRDLQFKVKSERQIFEKFFMAIWFYCIVFLSEGYWEENSRKKYFFVYFGLMSKLGFELWSLV